MLKFCLLLFFVFITSSCFVSGWKINRIFKKRISLSKFLIVGSILGGIQISSATAAIDCNRDCYKNCVIVAPGSDDYCKASCTDYCQQDDRHDGLSGSVDSSSGETGLFGGSIDRNTISDRPPRGIKFIPDDTMKGLMINNGFKKSG